MQFVAFLKSLHSNFQVLEQLLFYVSFYSFSSCYHPYKQSQPYPIRSRLHLRILSFRFPWVSSLSQCPWRVLPDLYLDVSLLKICLRIPFCRILWSMTHHSHYVIFISFWILEHLILPSYLSPRKMKQDAEQSSPQLNLAVWAFQFFYVYAYVTAIQHCFAFSCFYGSIHSR